MAAFPNQVQMMYAAPINSNQLLGLLDTGFGDTFISGMQQEIQETYDACLQYDAEVQFDSVHARFAQNWSLYKAVLDKATDAATIIRQQRNELWRKKKNEFQFLRLAGGKVGCKFHSLNPDSKGCTKRDCKFAHIPQFPMVIKRHLMDLELAETRAADEKMQHDLVMAKKRVQELERRAHETHSALNAKSNELMDKYGLKY